MKHLGYSRIIKAKDLRVLARYAAVGACIKTREKAAQNYFYENCFKMKSA